MAKDLRECQEALTFLFVACIYYYVTLDKSLHLCHILLLDYKSVLGECLSQFAFVPGKGPFRYYCKTSNRNKDKRFFSGTLAFHGDRDFFLSLLWYPLMYKNVHSLCRLPSSKNLLTWNLLFIQLNKCCEWMCSPWKVLQIHSKIQKT